ncbi:MAG: tRNA (adenosine(37)-N6)-threonylcarbamoyltransferase complex transferase subunit TsaD [Patescibacteria group bacterium]|nr:tRNA (adenosine(37)-N6)-threonylcarbamoyltransferase complex transferase subunit TsaD [Patescibacteria group bacterium]
MKILGIESSCDDTSAALLECSKSGCFVLRESTASQIAIHKKYGGVVPEIAGRMHAEKIIPLIEHVLNGKKPDVIAVASGPGLITGLIVGVEAARTLSAAWKIPVISVNHMAGHIHSVEIDTKCHPREGGDQVGNDKSIEYPALALVVSGGHTEIIQIKKPGQYKMLGATRDDAAGECFDKVAKLLDLPYPGGPQISKLALKGNAKAIKFPRPMLNSDDYDFSFAGLKTSALYWLRDNHLVIPAKAGIQSHSKNCELRTVNSADFCASFEQAIVDTLVGKISRASKKFKPKTVILCGGVSANKKLRETLATAVARITPYSLFLTPSLSHCMDNAAMIAVAGYQKAQKKEYADLPVRSPANGAKAGWHKLKADPNWELGR